MREKAELNKEAIFSSINKLLAYSHGHYQREWGHKNIPPRILVERMLLLDGGLIPDDYEFFVYHGRVHFAQISQRNRGDIELAYFDRAWNRLPMTLETYTRAGDIPKPTHLDRLIELAEKIGQGFDFLCVDLYLAGGQIYLGECTFYPQGGLVSFVPNEWDATFSAPWKIPTPSTTQP